MRTIDIDAMQMASFISGFECFKNPHPAGSGNWHWHKRVIRETASHIANMPQAGHPLIRRARIFGTLEMMQRQLAMRAPKPRQTV